MKIALLALLFVACGPAPRCVVRSVAIHGGTFECSEVETAISAAEFELQKALPHVRVPAGSITFTEGEGVVSSEGEIVNGESWCRPFEMTIGQRPWGESALAHELAHWMTGCTRDDGEGGHAGWNERGITSAIRRWRQSLSIVR